MTRPQAQQREFIRSLRPGLTYRLPTVKDAESRARREFIRRLIARGLVEGVGDTHYRRARRAYVVQECKRAGV